MSETASNKRPVVLMVAAVLAAPTFGAGLWVGKSSVAKAPEQTPQVNGGAMESAADGRASIELEACQRKLARRKKAVSASSATEVHPDALADAGTPVGPIDALQKEIKTCRRNELLHGAEICRSVRLHLDALLGLPKNDVLCHQRVRVSDYIEEDFDKCAPFTKPPTDSDLEGYTQEERKTILDAVAVAKSLDEEKLADLLNGVHQGCYGAPGVTSP